MTCSSCGAEVLDIDMKCGACGAMLAASGAHKMLGSMVLGQYQLVDILGQGGMSVVFKGKHTMTDQEVALKILPPELAAHSQVKGRFLEEAKALAALDHPNIVHLYTFGQENGCFVLAMQFVQGRTWERLIIENKRLDPSLSSRIAVDVLRALEYAHGRGVVHRDMKPSNVLVRDRDQSATVMDFGIAKMTTSTRLTATGQTMGTVRYMSPEQVRGQEVDARTDLYSLGATLYESLTGETPFDGQTHFDIMTKHLSEPPKRPSLAGVAVPVAIEDVVMRSLAKRADDRFQTARDMRLALESALRASSIDLVETQRVSREALEQQSGAEIGSGASPPAPRVSELTPTTSRPTSSTDIAAALARPRRGSGIPWLAIAVFLVVAGGGGTAAYILTHDRSKPPAKPAEPPLAPWQVSPHEPSFVAGKTVTEAQLHASYQQAADELQTALRDLHVTLHPPIAERIVAVAKDMCDASLYTLPVPQTCKDDRQAVASDKPSTLLVIDDPARLDAGMREGLAVATFTFEPFTIDGVGSAGQAAAHENVRDLVYNRMKAFMDAGSSSSSPGGHPRRSGSAGHAD